MQFRCTPIYTKMDHDETGCHPAPEGPILCVNNCGFFGSSANMNMCSKCYKDLVLNQEKAKFAASSIENIVNGSSSSGAVEKEPAVAATVKSDVVEVKTVAAVEGLEVAAATSTAVPCEPKTKEAGPKRCTACKKRVGLTGFTCRCGYLYCGSHRYSDKHDCSFDYRTAGQDAIAKANPVVKADKLDRI